MTLLTPDPHNPRLIDEILSAFWKMTDEKGVGTGVRYAQACQEFIRSSLTKAVEAALKNAEDAIEVPLNLPKSKHWRDEGEVNGWTEARQKLIEANRVFKEKEL